ncbi:hypothetical protein HZS_6351, partial [Henneguya salminicola]
MSNQTNTVLKENESEDFKILDTLLDIEKKVDNMIMSKRLEMQEWLSLTSRVKCKIRVMISTAFAIPALHTVPNVILPVEKETLNKCTNLGNIELKIEGKIVEACLVPDTFNLNSTSTLPTTDFSRYIKSFSSFFKNVFVEFDPTVYGSDIRCLEWVRSTKTTENDGFILRRPILTKNNFNITFVFTVNSTPQQFTLSQPLASILCISCQTKAHIITLFWKYININNLIDTYRPDIVHCNEALNNMFGVGEFNISEIPSLILSHLLPLQPHSFTINIENPLAKANLMAGVYSSTSHTFDILTEVSDFFKDPSQPFIVEYDNKTISMDVNELQALDQKTKQTTEDIAQIKNKIRDYNRYIENPPAFVNHWLNSQSKLSSNQSNQFDNTPSLPDDERSSEFFNKPWIQEYVHRYIFNIIENK